MAYIKKLDNFVNETSIAVYPPRGSKRVERLGAEEYMDMGNPDSKDFNDTLKPFKYKNCWLYPVAAMYRTFDKAYADKIKQCTAKKNDMSWCPLNDDFNAQDFCEALEKYGYGKCEVFAYRSEHTGINFYKPVYGGFGSSDYFAEYDIWRAGDTNWREIEYKLNKIFDKCCPETAYWAKVESRSFRGGRMLNESKLLDTIKKYDSRKLDSIEALVHNEYSLTLDGLIALYEHFYSNDISFFTDFLFYIDGRNEWLKDEYGWWDFIKTYVAYKLLDDISVNEIVQAVIDEEYVNYMSDPDDIFEEFNRNETGKWAEGICAELGIQAPEMED